MNDTRVAPAGLTPWHLWLVGLLMLAWNAMSCYSHVMTLTQNAPYFRATGVTPQIAAFSRHCLPGTCWRGRSQCGVGWLRRWVC